MLKRIVDAIGVERRGEGGGGGGSGGVRDEAAALRAALLTAKLCSARVKALPGGTRLADTEFSVFSQWGEDGIIQYLISRVPTPSRTFVEFGIQNYIESNTRYLLINDNWRGLVLDSSQRFIDYVKSDAIFWKHDLEAVCAFITRENINDLIAARFPDEELGLLSVDIDGNDYWVWKAIDRVRPSIVICEYNSVLGSRAEVVVPYKADFDRHAAHWSGLYFGASLPAFCKLAAEKGYSFVGSNTAGNNAFFVRNDRLGGVKPVTAAEGHVESRFRESRDEAGRLTYIAGAARLRVIAEMPVIDLASGQTRRIGEVYAAEIAAAT